MKWAGRVLGVGGGAMAMRAIERLLGEKACLLCCCCGIRCWYGWWWLPGHWCVSHNRSASRQMPAATIKYTCAGISRKKKVATDKYINIYSGVYHFVLFFVLRPHPCARLSDTLKKFNYTASCCVLLLPNQFTISTRSGAAPSVCSTTDRWNQAASRSHRIKNTDAIREVTNDMPSGTQRSIRPRRQARTLATGL